MTFRIYYLAGGVLAVGILGLGATWLHARRDVALFASGAVLATVDRGGDRACSAPMSTRRKLAEGGLRPPPNSALTGLAFLFAIALNSFGTLALLGGIVRSLRRRERVVANLLIGAGRAGRREQRHAHAPRRRLRHRARRAARGSRDDLRRLRAGLAAARRRARARRTRRRVGAG